MKKLLIANSIILLLLLGVGAFAEEDQSELEQKWAKTEAPVDDPIGLGERLAIIEYLHEHKIKFEAGLDLAGCRILYWRHAEKLAAPAKLRTELKDKYGIEAEEDATYEELKDLKKYAMLKEKIKKEAEEKEKKAEINAQEEQAEASDEKVKPKLPIEVNWDETVTETPTIIDTMVSGSGQFLLLRFENSKSIAIYDMIQRKLVGSARAPSAKFSYASGGNKLVTYTGEFDLLSVFELPSGKKVLERMNPCGGKIRTITMGASNSKRALVGYEKDTKVFDGFIKVEDLSFSPAIYPKRHYGYPMNFSATRVASDGLSRFVQFSGSGSTYCQEYKIMGDQLHHSTIRSSNRTGYCKYNGDSVLFTDTGAIWENGQRKHYEDHRNLAAIIPDLFGSSYIGVTRYNHCVIYPSLGSASILDLKYFVDVSSVVKDSWGHVDGLPYNKRIIFNPKFYSIVFIPPSNDRLIHNGYKVDELRNKKTSINLEKNRVALRGDEDEPGFEEEFISQEAHDLMQTLSTKIGEQNPTRRSQGGFQGKTDVAHASINNFINSHGLLNIDTAFLCRGVALKYYSYRDYANAKIYAKKNIEIVSGLYGKDDVKVIPAWMLLGRVQHYGNSRAQVADSLRKAFDIHFMHGLKIEKFEDNAYSRLDSAYKSLRNNRWFKHVQGINHAVKHKRNDILERLVKMLDDAEEEFGRNGYGVVSVYDYAAQVEMQSPRPNELRAGNYFKHALSITEAKFGNRHENNLPRLRRLALHYQKIRSPEQAMLYFKSWVGLQEILYGLMDKKVELACDYVANKRFKDKDYYNAIMYYEKAKNIADKSGRTESYIYAKRLHAMGDIHLTLESQDEARPLYEKALKIYEKLSANESALLRLKKSLSAISEPDTSSEPKTEDKD